MTTLAFVFPGQGSHRAGMASAWAGQPSATQVLAEVRAATGLDIVNLADDAERCSQFTAAAQPSILAVSLVALRALQQAGIQPDYVAGHSLGEISAAVAAGALTTKQAAEIVLYRSRAMAAGCLAIPGTMAAVVGVEALLVDRIVERLEDVVVANENAPGQTVIAGSTEGIEAAAAELREAGARVLPLAVEGAFHSPAMTPAVSAVATALARTGLGTPHTPVISGATARVTTTADELRRSLVDGVISRVRWVGVQERLTDLGVDTVIEVGPGNVLRGLARRAMPGVRVINVATPDDVAAAVEQLRDAELVTTTA